MVQHHRLRGWKCRSPMLRPCKWLKPTSQLCSVKSRLQEAVFVYISGWPVPGFVVLGSLAVRNDPSLNARSTVGRFRQASRLSSRLHRHDIVGPELHQLDLLCALGPIRVSSSPHATNRLGTFVANLYWISKSCSGDLHGRQRPKRSLSGHPQRHLLRRKQIYKSLPKMAKAANSDQLRAAFEKAP